CHKLGQKLTRLHSAISRYDRGCACGSGASTWYNVDMIEQLFGSKTRVKLLQLFYSNPNRSFYVREITRKIDEQINSVRRELANLLSIGIISSENTNNKLYYEVNQHYEFHQALSAIFGGGVASAPKAPAAENQAVMIKGL